MLIFLFKKNMFFLVIYPIFHIKLVNYLKLNIYFKKKCSFTLKIYEFIKETKFFNFSLKMVFLTIIIKKRKFI